MCVCAYARACACVFVCLCVCDYLWLSKTRMCGFNEDFLLLCCVISLRDFFSLLRHKVLRAPIQAALCRKQHVAQLTASHICFYFVLFYFFMLSFFFLKLSKIRITLRKLYRDFFGFIIIITFSTVYGVFFFLSDMRNVYKNTKCSNERSQIGLLIKPPL